MYNTKKLNKIEGGIALLSVSYVTVVPLKMYSQNAITCNSLYYLQCLALSREQNEISLAEMNALLVKELKDLYYTLFN